jgi:hypothetical protein
MKVKTLAILLIVLAVLTGLVFVVFMQRSPREGKRELGAPLLKNFPANDITSVTILDAGNEGVQLVQSGVRWVVKNRFGYPADFQKITELVRNLRDAKIGRSFEATKGVLERLHLKDPADNTAPKEEKGTAIIFADAKGKTLVRVCLGEPMKGGQGGIFPEGQYVLLGNGKTVYLVDKQFESFAKSPSEWLKKDLIDVKAADVREVVCLDPDGKTTRFAFKRQAKGKDLEQVHPAPGKKIERTSLNRLAGALSGLRIEDVLDPTKGKASIGMKDSSRLEYRLFNGMVYDLYPGKKCKEAGSCYLKVGVRYENPGPTSESSGKDAHGKKKEDAGKQVEQKAESLNKKLGRWIYKIPQWKHEALVTDLESLVKKEKKK